MKERAILVTLRFDSVRRESNEKEAAIELEELSKSAGLQVIQNCVYRQKAPNPGLLMGTGKAEEVRLLAKKEKASVVVFEANLTSTQQRNIEKVLQIKTIDRTQLILDIFAQRAHSTEGKLQVELAQIQYLLPRLGGEGIYLSRLGGGVGTRGPGEQKLEMDRRRIRERIARLTRELEELQVRRQVNLQKKKESNTPLVALVGYTNAGKSTLFNTLSKSSVVAKNQLFSTLDTTTRQVVFPGNHKALLVDTVGFVRDLPHHLIESFKATLEETVQADILLHVVDASRLDLADLKRAVEKVLADLGADNKKTFLVFNKTDLISQEAKEELMRKYWQDGIFVSAHTGSGIVSLETRISRALSRERKQVEFFIPTKKLGMASFLYEQTEVHSRRDEPHGSYFTVHVNKVIEEIFLRKLNDR